MTSSRRDQISIDALTELHAAIADALRRAPLDAEAQADAVIDVLKSAGLTPAAATSAAPAPGTALSDDDWSVFHHAEAEIARGHGVA